MIILFSIKFIIDKVVKIKVGKKNKSNILFFTQPYVSWINVAFLITVKVYESK